MLRPYGDGLPQHLLPLCGRLARNGEDEIEIEVVEPGLSQRRDALLRHRHGVDAAQPFQQRVIERLHAQRSAIHAECPQQPGLLQRDSGGVHPRRSTRSCDW